MESYQPVFSIYDYAEIYGQKKISGNLYCREVKIDKILR